MGNKNFEAKYIGWQMVKDVAIGNALKLSIKTLPIRLQKSNLTQDFRPLILSLKKIDIIRDILKFGAGLKYINLSPFTEKR